MITGDTKYGASFDVREELAAAVYKLLQENLEDPEMERLVSMTGNFDDANEYTRRLFRVVVNHVWKEAIKSATATELPQSETGDGLRKTGPTPGKKPTAKGHKHGRRRPAQS